MSWNVSNKPNRLGNKENLCWSCEKYIQGCDWSEKLKPVKGWNAELDSIGGPLHGDLHAEAATYKIYDCPEFVQEKKKKCGKNNK